MIVVACADDDDVSGGRIESAGQEAFLLGATADLAAQIDFLFIRQKFFLKKRMSPPPPLRRVIRFGLSSILDDDIPSSSSVFFFRRFFYY